MRPFARRFLAVLLSVSLGAPCVVPAGAATPFSVPGSADAAPAAPIAALAGLQPLVPLTLGTVRGNERPGSSGRTVYFIEDVHRNDEAQRNISGAVATLAGSGRATLIGIEGATGPVSFGALAAYPYRDSVAAIADYLLATHRIGGAVHAALGLAAKDALVVGIDDEAAHRRNEDAYRDAAGQTGTALAALDRVASALDRQKALLPAPLARLDHLMDERRAGRLSLAAYIEALIAENGSIPSDLAAFVEADRFEQSAGLAEAERTRARLLARFEIQLPAAELTQLSKAVDEVRAGRRPAADLYRALLRFAGACPDVPTAPLVRYVRYLDRAAAVDPAAVIASVSAVEAALLARRTPTPAQRRLFALRSWLASARALVRFSLTRDDWDAYERLSPEIAASGLTFPDLSRFESFYREARRRDDLMANALLSAMDRANARSAILVAGGFHSRGVADRLEKAGVAVVTIAPRVTRTTDGAAYLSAFAQQRTPLDRLFQGERLFLAPKQVFDADVALGMAAGRDAVLGRPEAPAAKERVTIASTRLRARVWSRTGDWVLNLLFGPGARLADAEAAVPMKRRIAAALVRAWRLARRAAARGRAAITGAPIKAAPTSRGTPPRFASFRSSLGTMR